MEYIKLLYITDWFCSYLPNRLQFVQVCFADNNIRRVILTRMDNIRNEKIQEDLDVTNNIKRSQQKQK